MVEKPIVSGITGEIVATDVSFEEYLEKYAADFCEWVGGTVEKMSPIHERHDILMRYIVLLLEAFFDVRPIARLREAPFVMRLPDKSREPDIQIILNSNPHTLTPTYMDGPADICIEIVSPESVERDHGAKVNEYQRGRVPEYWILDPIHRETRFFRLNSEGIYEAYEVDEDKNYTTPQLPGLKLHVPTLWQDPLPGYRAIGEAVDQMLSE